MVNNEHIEELWSHYRSGKADGQAQQQFLQWAADPANAGSLQSMLDNWYDTIPEGGLPPSEINGLEMLEEILGKVAGVTQTVHRVHFMRKWWWAAAAVLILGATIAIVVSSDRRVNSSGNPGGVATALTEIAPGTNRAVLTVDNKQIDLSSDKTGITVGNTIAYSDGEKLSDAGQLLTLTTPRGGQYQLVLPDGSKIWLNSSSSVKFPSRFTSDKREVEITGEVYLEVAKNLKMPFRVKANNTIVEVLGTEFNVNAYNDESTLKTTLIGGSVKVLVIGKEATETTGRSVRYDQLKGSEGDGIILQPGQQAVSDGDHITRQIADIDKVLAWKNGFFSVQDEDFGSFMRQIERWYDINVKYEGRVPTVKFQGKMDRGVPLSIILKYLKALNIETQLDGKTLIVKNQ